jgi:peroxiredoxin
LLPLLCSGKRHYPERSLLIYFSLLLYVATRKRPQSCRTPNGHGYMRVSVLASLAVLSAGIALQVGAAEIGSRIGHFQLTDLSGQSVTSQAYSGKVVVFVFWSFKCPVSLVYDDRLEALQGKYGSRGVAVVAVSSGQNQNPAEIQANASNLKLTIPVLVDPDGDLAEKLGATHTPSAFVLDSSGVLRYKGALDNNKKPGENGRTAYVENALESILAGTPVEAPETKPFGCSIKRKGL